VYENIATWRREVCILEDQFNEFYQTIGDRIRELRVRQGMSQADLAEKAHLSLPVISSIENAHSKIWLVTFAKIAEALQVSADDILRLNTPEANEGFPKEMSELFDGCTPAECESILRIAKQVKSTFESQRKEYPD